jgi:hypothetical protein
MFDIDGDEEFCPRCDMVRPTKVVFMAEPLRIYIYCKYYSHWIRSIDVRDWPR